MHDCSPIIDTALPANIDPPVPQLTSSPEKVSGDWAFSFVLLVLIIAVGAVVELLDPPWARVLFEPIRLNSLTGISSVLTAFAAVIVLHESGHLVVALGMRFEILGVSLGPFRISRLHGKSTVQFSVKKLFTGSVSAIPRDSKSWRIKTLVVVSAGCAATLASGIASAYALRYLHAHDWFYSTLSTMTTLSLLLLILNLIPNGPWAQMRSDAQFFLALLRNASEAQEIHLYYAVTQLKILGIRPRDYPKGLIQSLATPCTRADISLVCAETIVLWAIDRGSVETADAWDRRAVELSRCCNKPLQNIALAKSGYFDVLFRSDLAAARSKFEKVDLRAIEPHWLRCRLRAAQSIATGRSPDALAFISRARLPKHLPYYEFEEMLLNKMKRRWLVKLN